MTDLQIEVAFRFCEITGTTCPFYWNKYEASILFVPLIANVGSRWSGNGSKCHDLRFCVSTLQDEWHEIGTFTQ